MLAIVSLKEFIGLLRRALVLCSLVVVLVSSACSESVPTAPSALVTLEGPGFSSSLVCSTDIDRVLNMAQEVNVVFPLASIGGKEVAKSTCDPSSGSLFSIGTTTVTCSAAAGPDMLDSCQFSVRVAMRRLTVTKVVAFGDSITSGFVSRAAVMPTLAGPPVSYPAQLQDRIEERYPDQAFTIVNAGLGGENTMTGRDRLPGVLDTYRPEVLLLLEGINELDYLGATKVASDLEKMVALGLSRGADVLLATLTPVGNVRERQRPGTRAAVQELNAKIRQIAQNRNLGPVVDLFSVFKREPSLLGRDGLHPTAAGYQAISDAFLEAIVLRWEVTKGPAISLSLPTARSVHDGRRTNVDSQVF